MYKNKIKSRLQKILNDQDATPERQGDESNHDSLLFKSTRKAKISLSKDLSLASHSRHNELDSTKENNSESKGRRSFLKVVSSRKDLHDASELALTKKDINSISLSKCVQLKEEPSKKCSFFDKVHAKKRSGREELDLKVMAVNLAKSAAIFKDKIVPVLLRAAGESISVIEEGGEGDLFQTPIRQLKISCDFVPKSILHNDQPSNSTYQMKETHCVTPQYKNKHRIEHSPTPVKAANPTYSQSIPSFQVHRKVTANTLFGLHRSESFLHEESEEAEMHPLSKQLESINLQRKEAQDRISRKLDEISERANSMARLCHNEQDSEMSPKKHKVLCLHPTSYKQKSAIVHQTNLSQSQKVSEPLVPNEKSRNMRSMIMTRIFS